MQEIGPGPSLNRQGFLRIAGTERFGPATPRRLPKPILALAPLAQPLEQGAAVLGAALLGFPGVADAVAARLRKT